MEVDEVDAFIYFIYKDYVCILILCIEKPIVYILR